MRAWFLPIRFNFAFCLSLFSSYPVSMLLVSSKRINEWMEENNWKCALVIPWDVSLCLGAKRMGAYCASAMVLRRGLRSTERKIFSRVFISSDSSLSYCTYVFEIPSFRYVFCLHFLNDTSFPRSTLSGLSATSPGRQFLSFHKRTVTSNQLNILMGLVGLHISFSHQNEVVLDMCY